MALAPGQTAATTTPSHTVLAGSNPCQSHWKGRVAGLAMPADAVAIQEAEARQLVACILALEAGKTS